MYYPFCQEINAVDSTKAFEKIKNNFEEYVPFNKKPILVLPEYTEQNKLLAVTKARELLNRESEYNSLPYAECIDIGAKKGQKKHYYIIFGFYHN